MADRRPGGIGGVHWNRSREQRDKTQLLRQQIEITAPAARVDKGKSAAQNDFGFCLSWFPTMPKWRNWQTR
jgi:hypothetical protein